MKIPRNIFRKYDIRGIAEKDITEELAYHIGRGFGTIIRKNGGKKVSVGQDVRPTSPAYAKKLMEGLRDSGLLVYDLGVVPTPVQYYSIYKLNLDGGVEVTASHNPRDYNGFKLSIGKMPFFGDDIQKLADIIEKEDYIPKEEGKIEEHDILTTYIDEVSSGVKIDKNLKIGIDTGNGVGGPVIEKILQKIGLQYEGLYLEPDGRFPNHIPDPIVPEYMEELKKLVKTKGLDIGIGLDGDCDRVGVITDEGELLFGDKFLALFVPEVLKDYPGAPIIFDVKCTKGLIDVIKKYGGKPVMWKTGHALIKAKLREINAPLAGEMSGHIEFNDRYYGFDDAIYDALRMLELLSMKKRKLSEMVKEIPFYYATPEIRVYCPDDKKFEVVDTLVNIFKEKYEVIDIDGARIEFEDGFGLVRASNTQPVLVLRFEAKTEERLEEIKELIISEIKKFKEVDFERGEA